MAVHARAGRVPFVNEGVPPPVDASGWSWNADRDLTVEVGEAADERAAGEALEAVRQDAAVPEVLLVRADVRIGRCGLAAYALGRRRRREVLGLNALLRVP